MHLADVGAQTISRRLPLRSASGWTHRDDVLDERGHVEVSR